MAGKKEVKKAGFLNFFCIKIYLDYLNMACATAADAVVVGLAGVPAAVAACERGDTV